MDVLAASLTVGLDNLAGGDDVEVEARVLPPAPVSHSISHAASDPATHPLDATLFCSWRHCCRLAHRGRLQRHLRCLLSVAACSSYSDACVVLIFRVSAINAVQRLAGNHHGGARPQDKRRAAACLLLGRERGVTPLPLASFMIVTCDLITTQAPRAGCAGCFPDGWPGQCVGD